MSKIVFKCIKILRWLKTVALNPKIDRNKMQYRILYNCTKTKWQWTWKEPNDIFHMNEKRIEGDWINWYDHTNKLFSMKLTDEAHKKSFWMLRNPCELLTSNGYNVDQEKSFYLEQFIEGKWVDTYSWFVAAIIDKSHSDEMVKWIIGPLKEFMTEHGVENLKKLPFNAPDFGLFVEKIANKTITATMAKTILFRMFNSEKLDDILKEDIFKITSNNEVVGIVNKVLQANPEQVAELQAGKDKLLTWLVGQVMKESRGKANAADVKEMITTTLNICLPV